MISGGFCMPNVVFWMIWQEIDGQVQNETNADLARYAYR